MLLITWSGIGILVIGKIKSESNIPGSINPIKEIIITACCVLEIIEIITEFNPIRYFVEIMRMVLLKGSGFMDILPQLLKTLAYAIVMNVMAVWCYKKVN